MSLDVAACSELWYGPAWLSLPLWPLGWIFRLVVALRRGLYSIGLLRRHRMPVPVVVVGNLTVGGTGKTPITAWLARQLSLRGHRVGVVLRGYGGRHSGAPRLVTASDDPADVGDEALLHARRAPHVVVIGADRVAAASLAAEQGAEAVVCDDGLQHLRLARDYEIAVVDAVRGLGNRHLLPAGPLREPASRLEAVDAVRVCAAGPGRCSAGPSQAAVTSRRLVSSPGSRSTCCRGERRPLAAFQGAPVHAVAGIGHPAAFFACLRRGGTRRRRACACRTMRRWIRTRCRLPDDATVLMTEKDAVKCAKYARPGWWYVELDVVIDRGTARDLIALVLERTGLTGAGVNLG